MREGAEWRTGGTSRDGDGTGMGVPTYDGVADLDRECDVGSFDMTMAP